MKSILKRPAAQKTKKERRKAQKQHMKEGAEASCTEDVKKEAARAVKCGKAYRPKGKNAEERAMMVAVAKKQNKLVKHVRREAARAVKCGILAYRPKGKNAEERAMMAAVVAKLGESELLEYVAQDEIQKKTKFQKGTLEFQKKMEVTDKAAKDAARLSKKAMACSSKAMAAVKKVAASEATTETEVRKLRKRQEVLEHRQETEWRRVWGAMRGEIDGMKEVLEKRWANDVTTETEVKKLRKRQEVLESEQQKFEVWETRWEQMLPIPSQQSLQKFTADLANDAMAAAAQAMAANEGLGKRQKEMELELRELQFLARQEVSENLNAAKLLRALGDRMQRAEAEIQTMKHPNGADTQETPTPRARNIHPHPGPEPATPGPGT